MDYQLFEQFTNTSGTSSIDFLINVLIIVILSFILEWTYNKCAKSISNRKMFSANFILIAFTTMLIITVVKSSIALSLGLVGALSIVRFRSAIKEPEELAYIFLTISLGLGLGANQRIITLIAFAAILLIIWLRFLIMKKPQHQNLFLNIYTSDKDFKLDETTRIIESVFGKYKINRFEKRNGSIEASFIIDSKKAQLIQQCSNELEKKYSAIDISYIDFQ